MSDKTTEQQCKLSSIREDQRAGRLSPIPPDWLHLLSQMIERPLVSVEDRFISCLTVLPSFSVIIDMHTKKNTVSIMEYCPMPVYKEAEKTKKGMKCDPSKMAMAHLLFDHSMSICKPMFKTLVTHDHESICDETGALSRIVLIDLKEIP